MSCEHRGRGLQTPTLGLWRALPLLLGCAAALCCGLACASSDLVSDICRQSPPAARSYAGVINDLHALQSNPRVTLDCAGRTAQGRTIPIAIVHDPDVPLESLVRVFIIARQHGGEEAGTTASLALLRYFATSDDALAGDLMRQLALVIVPVANPDGMSAWRRANGGGTDLNRDWYTFSQPETRAIAAAVRKYRPHALIDMHELPAASGKPAYRDNFIQTIGKAARLPVELSKDCATTSARLESWMGQSRIPVTVYYDTPGESLNLCHRYFGLNCGIPSYLFEAKCGSARPLSARTRFHVLGTLIVANYALHRYYDPTEAPQLAVAPQQGPPPPPAGPVEVQLAQPGEQQVARGQMAVVAAVKCAPEGAYVLFHVDGAMKALTNAAPHEYLLDTCAYSDGQHSVDVQVCDPGGRLLAQARANFVIDNKLAAGE
ncbi:MAG: M14 family zinc carboxypeptidase [Armatimonadota bacterium]